MLKKLVKRLKSRPTVFMFDGNGVLHPYYCGLASHAGIVLNVPSIGVAKRLLYGNVVNNFVNIDGNKRGYAFFSSERVKNPVFVSPGHRISFETSLDIVKHLSYYKIPEPLRQADVLAKKNLKS